MGIFEIIMAILVTTAVALVIYANLWVAKELKRQTEALALIVAQPLAAESVWFEADADLECWIFAKTLADPRICLAETSTVRSAYSQLQNAGVTVENVPAWLVDPQGVQPFTDFETFQGSPLGLLSSAMRLVVLAGVVGACIWLVACNAIEVLG
jgi:Flp pilus assembly protein TadB